MEDNLKSNNRVLQFLVIVCPIGNNINKALLSNSTYGLQDNVYTSTKKSISSYKE